ncbi:MAG TPA: hypothetical protein VMS17_21875 [Gemmataceae bacterium]|nr:hypothetical protein [Gemmataceae bacterium]
MKYIVACAAILAASALPLGGETKAYSAPTSRIYVTFTNNTNLQVGFFLNGGGGLQTSLAPGATQSYTMVVDPGVQPIIRINQLTGPSLAFTVQDGGNYSIQVDADGKIRNFYAN